MSRCSTVTPGIICRKPAINSSPASCSAANGIAGRLSRMNHIRSASALNRVLPPGANPSIAILCKLAAALGLSVADIVNVTRAPAAYLIESQDIPTLWHGDRGGSARLLAGTQGPNMIELWRWEMAPGKPMHRAATRRAPSSCCTLSEAS